MLGGSVSLIRRIPRFTPFVTALVAAIVLYALPAATGWHPAFLLSLSLGLMIGVSLMLPLGTLARCGPPQGRDAALFRGLSVMVGALLAGVALGFAVSGMRAAAEARVGLPTGMEGITGIRGRVLEDVRPPDPTVPVSVSEVITARGRYLLKRKVFLAVDEGPELLRGSRVHARVAVGPDSRFLSAREVSTVESGSVALRGRSRARLRAIAGRGELELMLPLLIGDRSTLGRETEAAFRRAGALHMLALSGMHVALLVAAIYFLARQLLPWRGALISCLAFVLLFLWLVGPRPSLLRAVGLTAVSTFALLSARRSPSVNLLGLVFLASALAVPASSATLSFQLSYLALLGILLAAPSLNWLLDGRLPPLIRGPLSVGLAAQLATAPLIGYHFGIVYPGGVLISLLLAPVVTLFLWGALFVSFLSFLGFPGLVDALLPLLRGLEGWTYRLLELGAAVPPVRLEGDLAVVGSGALLALFWLVVLDAARRRGRADALRRRGMAELQGARGV